MGPIGSGVRLTANFQKKIHIWFCPTTAKKGKGRGLRSRGVCLGVDLRQAHLAVEDGFAALTLRGTVDRRREVLVARGPAARVTASAIQAR